ncbi:hypothetical protein BKA66DRAFT_479700 [Pyrenochaeta sp. MPI-SDFR-AT-0127]|nr:hypothetical protein BKA66DRAFT_479700 [Pyrenochaeta sp. MPI-SDFR-AT-0127]
MVREMQEGVARKCRHSLEAGARTSIPTSSRVKNRFRSLRGWQSLRNYEKAYDCEELASEMTGESSGPGQTGLYRGEDEISNEPAIKPLNEPSLRTELPSSSKISLRMRFIDTCSPSALQPGGAEPPLDRAMQARVVVKPQGIAHTHDAEAPQYCHSRAEKGLNSISRGFKDVVKVQTKCLRLRAARPPRAERWQPQTATALPSGIEAGYAQDEEIYQNQDEEDEHEEFGEGEDEALLKQWRSYHKILVESHTRSEDEYALPDDRTGMKYVGGA